MGCIILWVKYGIGVWGQWHKRFLKEHHKVRYYNLLIAGRLNSYLVDIEKQAEDMVEQAVKLLVEKEGVAEKLKVNSLWIGYRK